MPALATLAPVGASDPAVSVIIPHYNDLAALDRCLAALGRQTATIPFEIIVADNASPQGEAAVAAVIDGRARLVIAHDRGAGPARNTGVAAARATMLAFTDSDCVPVPGWLAAGLAASADHDVVGGKVSVLLPPSPLTMAQAFEAVFAFDNEAYIRDKGFTGAGNMFCTRATFDATGPFGVGLSEDLDWSHRARARGFTLGYADAAEVGHPARDDWPQLKRKWRRIQDETYALGPPTLGHRLRWLARGWAMPLSIVAHAPRIWRSPALTSARDRLAAFAGLTRIRLWRWVDAHHVLWRDRRG